MGEKEKETAIKKLKKLDSEIKSKLNVLKVETKNLERMRKSKVILFLSDTSIDRPMVCNYYEDYLDLIKKPVKRLDVIVDSGGGDIDAAYHLGVLFRQMVEENGGLNFIVPRWAKSAATLLICSGNNICMDLPSEMGPLDPQIIIDQQTGEKISPLSIKETFQFINKLVEEGHKESAKLIVEKMVPLLLGEYIRTLSVSKVYLKKILKSKMLKNKGEDYIDEIATILTEGFPHHGYCILLDDAKEIGLRIKIVPLKEWKVIWKIWRNYDSIRNLIANKRKLVDKYSIKIKSEKNIK